MSQICDDVNIHTSVDILFVTSAKTFNAWKFFFLHQAIQRSNPRTSFMNPVPHMLYMPCVSIQFRNTDSLSPISFVYSTNSNVQPRTQAVSWNGIWLRQQQSKNDRFTSYLSVETTCKITSTVSPVPVFRYLY
jgi:hypothetical protein